MEKAVTEEDLELLDEPESVKLVVDPRSTNIRLDQFLKLNVPDVSRSLIAASVKSQSLIVNGDWKKCSYRVKVGDVITGTLLSQPPLELPPEEIFFPVVFEDESILVLVKPPGLVVHPGSGNQRGTLANGLVFYCNSLAGVGSTVRPGLVHRLDKDTSGVLVVAKTDQAFQALIEQFKARSIYKEYIALVEGIPQETSGRIVAPIGRHPVHRQKMSVQYETGRYAVSRWERIESFSSGHALLKVVIETGRTHQIRVHCAEMGFPVAGDTVYGKSKVSRHFPRQMLHAFKIRLQHPVTGMQCTFHAPLWPDFSTALDVLAGGNYLNTSLQA